MHVTMHMQGKRVSTFKQNHKRLSKEDKSLVGVEYVCWREGFHHKSCKDKERKGPQLAKTRVGFKVMRAKI